MHISIYTCEIFRNSLSGGSDVFLKSIDASDKIKNVEYLIEILYEVIEQLGPVNVVQIVTDNESNYKSTGKKLMRKYTLRCTLPRPDVRRYRRGQVSTTM